MELDSIYDSIEFKNKSLYQEVKQAANKKFTKSSYVKNLWILNEYKRRGGDVLYKNKKPSKVSIKKSITGKVQSLIVEYHQDKEFTDENEVYGVEAAEAKKKLNKPFRTPNGPKKFSVYVKNDKENIVKVNFGDPNMEIKRDDPQRRKNFRARHGCDNPGPKWKAKYWSCKFWSEPSVTKLLSGESMLEQGAQETFDWQDLSI